MFSIFRSTGITCYLLLMLTACSGQSDVHDTRFLMGTLVEFTVSDSDQAVAEQAITAAAAEMQRIEDTFTIYGDLPNAVKAFNRSPVNMPVSLPDEVSRVLAVALHVQQQSGGAFDPALGGMNLLWGFSSDPPPDSPPAAAAIEQALPPAHCIERHGSQWLRTDSRCLLDFGGIAKGYAIDRGIALLKEHGIANAIINAGGDLRLIGEHHHQPWKIGIRHPRKPGEVITSLALQGDKSIVTSGDYERFFIYNNIQYHHILNPVTGWPATQNQSVTVIAPTAMLADAWSTALFIASSSVLPATLSVMRVGRDGKTVGTLQ
ncbi:MAG: thiamine biosynthesis protein [Zetaproteobacteria bacterium CG23_combo_of_CG06-09_8_20_14_all_54_7]|nr:MAG: thiamine biosynthesis protein [Zetaproteobacteria bacterium CG23_combo_of_CG06-09_8_20_14_all_54_7]